MLFVCFILLNQMLRMLLTAAGEDPDISFAEQLAPIPEENRVNIEDLLRVTRDHHLTDRIYTIDSDGVAKVIDCQRELKQQEQAATQEGYEGLLDGMYKKAITNLLKLAMVVACVRYAVSTAEVVQEDDVKTA